jgi:hypothetical protein
MSKTFLSTFCWAIAVGALTTIFSFSWQAALAIYLVGAVYGHITAEIGV